MNNNEADQYYTVQFFPCGCVYRMKRSEIIAAGAEQQLLNIENGKKLDAVILPSEDCEQCMEDHRMQDTSELAMLNREFDDFWAAKDMAALNRQAWQDVAKDHGVDGFDIDQLGITDAEDGIISSKLAELIIPTTSIDSTSRQIDLKPTLHFDKKLKLDYLRITESNSF